MRVLEVTPLGTFSWSFRVTAEGREITCLDIARLRDGGAFELAGIPYRLEREGTFRGRYSLVEHNRASLGTIRRRGFIQRITTATLDDKIPRPCQMLLLFLALVQWRRQAGMPPPTGR